MKEGVDYSESSELFRVSVQTDFRHPKGRVYKLYSNLSCEKQSVIGEYTHERRFYKKQ